MKTLTALIVLALCVGCDSKSAMREVRLKKLEQAQAQLLVEMTSLNDRIARAETNSLLNKADLATIRTLTEQTDSVMREVLALTLANQSNNTALLEWLESVPTNAPQTAASRPHSPQRVPTVSGVPEPVYRQIAAQAAADWPRDFDMQKYSIKKQVDAYIDLQRGVIR